MADQGKDHTGPRRRLHLGWSSLCRSWKGQGEPLPEGSRGTDMLSEMIRGLWMIMVLRDEPRI